MPFGTEPLKLLPALRSLNMAFNPLKSEYVEKLDMSKNEGIDFKLNDNKGKNENLKSQQTVKENGPMSRIQEIDLSGIDTKRTNICIILSQLPNLKVLISEIYSFTNKIVKKVVFIILH